MAENDLGGPRVRLELVTENRSPEDPGLGPHLAAPHSFGGDRQVTGRDIRCGQRAAPGQVPGRDPVSVIAFAFYLAEGPYRHE